VNGAVTRRGEPRRRHLLAIAGAGERLSVSLCGKALADLMPGMK
jgi:hypothetical protein